MPDSHGIAPVTRQSSKATFGSLHRRPALLITPTHRSGAKRFEFEFSNRMIRLIREICVMEWPLLALIGLVSL